MTSAEPVFGAAPLLTEEMRSGRLDAVLNFWTYAARLSGAGYRKLIGMDEVLKALGIDPVPSLVGFIWRESTRTKEGSGDCRLPRCGHQGERDPRHLRQRVGAHKGAGEAGRTTPSSPRSRPSTAPESLRPGRRPTRARPKSSLRCSETPAPARSWAGIPGSTRSSSMLQVVKAPAERIRLGRVGWSLVSLLALVAIWEIAALIAASRYLPGPWAVVQVMVREAQAGELWGNIAATLIRVAFSFVVAMFIGSAIGMALGRNPGADRFFDAWLIFFLNLPALVIIVLCYIWFGLTEVAAVTAVAVNKIPNVAVTMREGTRSLSKDLEEMAQVYHLGWWKTLRHVTMPQLAPYFAAAARSGLALVWKIVLVVEAFGRSDGVGHQLNIAFQLFDVPMILAYALAFIIVVQIIEMVILQPLMARANKWRR